ncbi:MAG: InlB B-repeat-containing protein, partial [Clostridiales Family XIII bacterium]|nr:InlB B-repeat-containing protein [Clostridiales Family XIII bacterium]
MERQIEIPRGKGGMKRMLAMLTAFIFLTSAVGIPALVKLDDGFALFGAPLPFATFDGVDLSTTPSAVTSFPDARGQFKSLLVNAAFGAEPKPKRVEITIANGLGIYEATGMQALNARKDNWTFNESLLPDQFDGIITGATWTQDALVNGYRPRSGKLVYTLAEGVTDFAPEIRIDGDNPFLANGGLSMDFPIPGIGSDRAYAIETESFQGGNILDNAALETYTVTDVNSSRYWIEGPEQASYITARGGTYALRLRHYLRYAGNPAGRFLQNGIELKFSLPKAAGLSGVSLTDPTPGAPVVTNTLTPGAFTWSLDDTAPEKDVITINIKPGADTSTVYLYLTGTVDIAASVGQTFTVAVDKHAVTRLDGTTVTNHTTYALPTIRVATEEDKLTFFTIGDNNSARINAKEIDSPADMVALGVLRTQNPNATTVSGHRLRLDFDTSSVGVQAVKLFTGEDGATDIVFTTTAGNTLYYPSAAKTQDGSESPARSHYAALSLYDALQPGEYIASVEYSMGDIKSGANAAGGYTQMASTHGAGLFYYGRLLSVPVAGHYAATATELKPKDGVSTPAYDNPEDWEPVQAPHEQKIYVKEGVADSICYMDVGFSGSAPGALTGGGPPRALLATYDFYNHHYSLGNLSARQGFVVYVREPDGLSVDPTSVYATVGVGGARCNPEGSFIDNTGATVYKITMPDAILGIYRKDLTPYPMIRVHANVTAKSTAPAGTVYASEIFFGNIIGGEQYPIIGYGGGPARVQDVLGFTDDENNLFAVPHPTAYLTINPSLSLNAATLADRGDDDWKYYQNGVDATIIDLNTERTARYRLDVRNASGADISGGFTALIPIPKVGETTGDARIQSDDFTWPLYVKEDIEAYLQTGYTVHYATSYLLDKDAGGWQDWNAVKSNWQNIRMVKITYAQTLPDGFADSLWFPLATCKDHLNGDEVNPYHGEVNIYSAFIHANVLGTATYRPSDPVALRLNTGVVEGYVWLDEDRDALAPGGEATPDDETDTPVRNAIVRVYEAGHANDPDFLLDSSATDAQGYYQFLALDRETNVDVVILNPGTAPAPLRFVAPSVSEEASLTISDKQPKPIGLEYINALVQKPYTVDFDTDGGTPVPSDQFVYVNGHAAKPAADPVKADYTFDGWYWSRTENAKWLFDTHAVTRDTTIYAKWTLATGPSATAHTLTYDLNDGGDTQSPADRNGGTAADNGVTAGTRVDAAPS